MAHAAPPPRDRRRSQLIGAVLVVVGAVAAFIAVAGLRHPHGRQDGAAATTERTVTVSSSPGSTRFSSPSTSKTSSPSSQSSKTTESSHPASQVGIYILNNSSRAGLAASVAAAMRAKGWTVVGTDNYSNDIISSCAYYNPSDSANLTAALSLQRQFPGIQRVRPRFPQLPSYPIVVVLNPDYPL
jgi:LytR cell envelope-related transcriptional attenuator